MVYLKRLEKNGIFCSFKFFNLVGSYSKGGSKHQYVIVMKLS
ncbi:conserved domain protein [delta proteobacterium NaphS2]|nr:conserved domain protein [delta proteobacterium NaphS2]